MGEGLKRAFAAARATNIAFTPKRRFVLRIIRDWKPFSAIAHPCARMIAVRCGKNYSDAEWAHEPLRALLALGYVRVVGKDLHGSRLWEITPEGRAALESNA